MALHPELDGQRIRATGHPEIYLVMDGQKRHVPDPETFNRLFRDWSIKDLVDIDAIERGQDISVGTCLAKDTDDGSIYFLDPAAGVKRHIVSAEVFDKYNFSQSHVESVTSHILMLIPNGLDIV